MSGSGGVVGVDEAGRGALAGPILVVAIELMQPVEGLADSKLLCPKRRDQLFNEILRSARMGVAVICPKTILRLNVLYATLHGMKKAILKLGVDAQHDIIIDGNKTPTMAGLQIRAIPKADALVPEVSAASIMAKVLRDRLMTKYHRIYDKYGFDQHKGYGTQIHYDALFEFGPSPIHRQGFNLNRQGTLFG